MEGQRQQRGALEGGCGAGVTLILYFGGGRLLEEDAVILVVAVHQ